MDRRRAVAGGLLGAVVGAMQFWLTRYFEYKPQDPGLGGIGQAFGYLVVVVVLTFVSLCLAAALLRLRYWFGVGLGAFMFQVFGLYLVIGLFNLLDWRDRYAALSALWVSAIAVVAFAGAIVPVKPRR